MAAISAHQRYDAEERILEAATELFAQSGYSGVSTREIASKACVNAVTIYRYYPHKRDLYIAVLDAELQQINLRGDLLIKIAEASDAKAVLSSTFELITKTITQRPGLVRLLQYSALEMSTDLDPLLRQHIGELIEVIARYVEPWITSGDLHSTSAKDLVLTLIAIVISYRSLHPIFANESTSPKSLLEAYAGLCMS